jgi:hypothetical protein
MAKATKSKDVEEKPVENPVEKSTENPIEQSTETPTGPAAEKTPPVAPTREQLQAEYDRLATLCSKFDRETQQGLRKFDEQRKELIAERKADRAALLKQKQEAFVALNALPVPEPAPSAE